MSTTELLRAQIEEAQAELAEKEALSGQLDAQIEEATERQRLRRELDQLQAEISGVDVTNKSKCTRRCWIDQDLAGQHQPELRGVAAGPFEGRGQRSRVVAWQRRRPAPA